MVSLSKAEATRADILKRAFRLVYTKGYQATSIDEILLGSPVTKGAFFYHFKNKEEMGLAMIREVMYPGMYQAMVVPLKASGDPLSEIHAMMSALLLSNPLFKVKYGCPAANLIEEMAPLNLHFNRALGQLFNEWQEAVVVSLDKAKKAGSVRVGVDSEQAACFILAGYNGIRNLGKLLGAACYPAYLAGLQDFLEGLR